MSASCSPTRQSIPRRTSSAHSSSSTTMAGGPGHHGMGEKIRYGTSARSTVRLSNQMTTRGGGESDSQMKIQVLRVYWTATRCRMRESLTQFFSMEWILYSTAQAWKSGMGNGGDQARAGMEHGRSGVEWGETERTSDVMWGK